MNKKTKLIFSAIILVLFAVGLAFGLLWFFGGKTNDWKLPIGMMFVLIGNILNLIRVIKLKKHDNDK
ncbi:MAG: hypothetical protein IKW96_06870 [Ruminococcus sp.]|uniref:hypothetical protein n=1 Tax=Ruminococcus sp. TaxID=41978 RepID=UPI0025E214AA|nr:hypothetical protein [Ruminococcus sp.]MBR5682986.1 hypothetical protein [Ruminococcus sp.]